jgi:DNA polymerase-3 subunit beta
MKFICNQSDLSASLVLVNRAVPHKPTHPVLANILLVATGEQVTLTSFDLSLGIRVSFPAKVEITGSVAIPAKLFVDIISRIQDGEIKIDSITDDESVTVNVKSKSGKYQIRAMSADEFPELPSLESTQPINIAATTLIDGLKGSLFAASAEESKQILTGVHISTKQNTLDFAATDGHRLAFVESSSDVTLNQIDVTVPARTLRELEKMLSTKSNVDELVSIYLDDGQVVFDWGNQRLTSRTLEGQYPAYKALIPKQFERIVTLDRKLFISTLERIAVLADQKNNVVKLSIDNDTQSLTLSCEAQEMGYGHETMQVTISGDSIDIACNVKYLAEGLKALPSSEIQMHINKELTPVIFTPLGGLKMIYLAMPVQMRN